MKELITNKITTLKLSATILLIVLLFSFHTTYAQFVPQSVSVVATPSSPSPNDTMSIEAVTPLFDKDTAFFSWTINGKSRQDLSGQGKSVITLIAGKVGSVINASVIATRTNGQGGQASLAILVSDLALTWFAETYIPKWYRGKALPIQNSIIDVIAIPNVAVDGSHIASKNLIFRWTLDDETNLQTGLGKDTFRMQFSQFTKQTYHVHEVLEDVQKKIRKEGDLFINPNSPLVDIYPFSPLDGIASRIGEGVMLSSKRGFLDFIIEPFFLPVASKHDLAYTWSVDQNRVSGAADNPYLLTIDTENETEREILISATAKTKDKSLLEVSKTFSLFFQ